MQANDASLMRRISAHIRSSFPSSFSSDSRPTTTHGEKQTAAAEATAREPAQNLQQSTKHEAIRIGTVLAETTSLVEQLGSPGLSGVFNTKWSAADAISADEDVQCCFTDAASAVEGSRAFLVAVYASSNVTKGDEHRYADKVRRAVERLRRAAVKALEALPANNKAARRLLQHIVEKGVDVVEATIYSVRLSRLTCQSIN